MNPSPEASLQDWWRCDGTTSTSPPGACVYAEPRVGDASVHPISARESRALRKLLREAPKSPHVFI
jgi:hypothetical protein